MTPEHRQAVADAAGVGILHASPLSGGCVGDVWRLDMADGRRLVAKTAGPHGPLEVEGYMLNYLARTETIPVPGVVHASPRLLVIDYVESGGRLDDAAQAQAADLLAALHGVSAPAYGHERDTLIGPLPQPNPWTESWIDFFRDHRLLHAGRLALDAGALPRGAYGRLEAFCGRLTHYIDEPGRPSLIHGDMWGGNVLTRESRIAGFIDPAIYHADPEIELAFSTLFGTFGDAFFRRYAERRPLRPGFFEARRDIYNLYPLLVHARLFGGHYGAQVDGILRRFV